MKSKCKIDNYGTKLWLNEQDKLHREDGPALEYANGGSYWYYQGEEIDVYSQEEFEQYLKLYTDLEAESCYETNM